MNDLLFIDSFPVFDGNNYGGLKDMHVPPGGCFIPGWPPVSRDAHAELEINAFKMVFGFPDQPSFFISKETWRILWEGKNPENDLSWLPEGYVVYGFVFCLAFHGYSSSDPRWITEDKGTGAYFRIRTIIKEAGEEIPVNGLLKVAVQTINIAYVDSDFISARQDNVVFLSKDNLEPLSRVNAQVVRKEGNGRLTDFFRTKENSIPRSVFEDKSNILSNEGCIFGSKRIEDILKDESRKGTTISLAIRAKNPVEQSGFEVFYRFKVNPYYDTNLPCPNPPVCDSNE